MIMPGLMDRRMKTRYRGEVISFTDSRSIICLVYGDSLDEMRSRKKMIATVLDVMARDPKRRFSAAEIAIRKAMEKAVKP